MHHACAHDPPCLPACVRARLCAGELINALVLGDELLGPELLGEELAPEDQGSVSKEISKRIKA